MKVYKNGMTLMRDTGSLTNALCENMAKDLKVGDMFCELLWTDRTLHVITEVINQKKFKAMRVKTQMKNWTEGTEYPEYDESGNLITEGAAMTFTFRYHNWWNGTKVHLQFGATTGYTDPSF